MARKKKEAEPASDLPPQKTTKRRIELHPENLLRGVRKRFTLEEVRRQLDFVEGLMVLGAANGSVVHQASRPPGVGGQAGGLGVSKSRARMLIARVIAKWDEEDRARSTSRRHEAAARIMRQIQNCQGKRDPRNPNVWLEKPNHKALIGYERELMKLQGTAAPIEIDINVRHSETMVAVFSRYSLETLQRLHAQARVKKELAAAYLKEHPEAREVVEAEGVSIG